MRYCAFVAFYLEEISRQSNLLIAQHRMQLEEQFADVNVHMVFLTETNAYTDA